MDIGNLVQQLKTERDQAAKDVQRINAALAALGNGTGTGSRRPLSAAARSKIAQAQRSRWAKIRAGKPQSETRSATPRLSLAARARIAKAQRARWAKVRAAKKGTAKAS